MIKLLGIGLIAYLLFIAQRRLYEKLWQKHLGISLSFGTNHIFEGEQGELREIIENRKRLPLSMLKVKFKTDRHLIFGNEKGSRTTDQYYRNDVFRIGGGERVTRTLKFRGGRRGYYTIDEVSLVASDLFFLSQLVADRKVQTEVYVYPKPYDAAKLRQSLIQLNGEMLSRRHLLEDPFEYRGIREYQPYDQMRSINWKATAKTGALMVNTFESTLTEQVMIYLDLEDRGILKYEHLIEESVSVAASLAQRLIGRGMEVGLCINAGIGGFATQNIPAAATTRLPVNNSESPSSRMEKDTAKKTPPIIILAPAGGKKQLADMEQVLAIRRADKDIVPFTKLFSEPSFADNSFFRSCRDAITIVISKNATQNQSAIERLIGQDQQAVWVVPYTAKEDCDVKTLSNIHVVRREVSPY